jgi:hypothetical protein
VAESLALENLMSAYKVVQEKKKKLVKDLSKTLSISEDQVRGIG